MIAVEREKKKRHLAKLLLVFPRLGEWNRPSRATVVGKMGEHHGQITQTA
jgi:hypothetical protein